jgi:hypothetical protein
MAKCRKKWQNMQNVANSAGCLNGVLLAAACFQSQLPSITLVVWLPFVLATALPCAPHP